MKSLICLFIIILVCKETNAQKVLSQATINNSKFRLIKLKVKNEDKYQCQKMGNKKWVVLFTKAIPSEGIKFNDVNKDGFLDVVLQYRWAQDVFIFNANKNNFHKEVQIGYEGFESFDKGKNLFYSFFSTKYEYGYEAVLYLITKNAVTLVAKVNEIALNRNEYADSLIYYKPLIKKEPFKIVVGQKAITEFEKLYSKENDDKHFTWNLFYQEELLLKQ